MKYFYKPKTKKEILDFLRRRGKYKSEFQKRTFKQLYPIYCSYFK